MKLFPHHIDPPRVRGLGVYPVPKAKFADIMDPTWDLTLQKVISHIDGVSDVRRIAHAASVSLELAKTALRHLLYYDTILLLDMFFFSACYAPRPGIHDFIRNIDGMVDECASYVSRGRGLVSNYHLIKLMSTLTPGKSVMEWLKGCQTRALKSCVSLMFAGSSNSASLKVAYTGFTSLSSPSNTWLLWHLVRAGQLQEEIPYRNIQMAAITSTRSSQNKT